MGISREPFCVELIYRKNAGPLFRGARFVRACAVGTHMGISHARPSLCGNYKNNPAHYAAHLDYINTGPCTLTARTPSVWPRCLGKKCRKLKIFKQIFKSTFFHGTCGTLWDFFAGHSCGILFLAHLFQKHFFLTLFLDTLTGHA